MDDADLILDLTGRKKIGKKPIIPHEPASTPVDVDIPPQADAGNTDLELRELKKKKPQRDLPIAGNFLKSAATLLGESNLIDAKQDWLDYTYDQLLFDIMRKNNPDQVTDENKRFAVKPPLVARLGTKKSAFVNFAEICCLLKRPPKHVLQFLLAELGTTGSIDGNNCLIVKGRFQQKHIQSMLCKYIKEYVTCHTCRSSDTELTKDTRLFFLQCHMCGSRCSVTAIKSGFNAVVGRRADIRRAAETTAG